MYRQIRCIIERIRPAVRREAALGEGWTGGLLFGEFAHIGCEIAVSLGECQSFLKDAAGRHKSLHEGQLIR